jgi:class 3 adenylate cyclase
MAELPTGTVTFLFTDIEGSTNLARTLGPRWVEVLDGHHSILRAAIRDHDGVDLRTEGDAFFAVFASAAGAVAASTHAQRGLAEPGWPGGGLVRVRMGMHTGEGQRGGDEYVGLAVHLAARIAAAGHGGQVVLSEATRALVGGTLPDGVRIQHLGTYRLKDFPGPERLHQLEIAGLPTAFPPLRALDVRRAHLPPEATTFIGRGAELEAIANLLTERRLVPDRAGRGGQDPTGSSNRCGRG